MSSFFSQQIRKVITANFCLGGHRPPPRVPPPCRCLGGALDHRRLRRRWLLPRASLASLSQHSDSWLHAAPGECIGTTVLSPVLWRFFFGSDGACWDLISYSVVASILSTLLAVLRRGLRGIFWIKTFMATQHMDVMVDPGPASLPQTVLASGFAKHKIGELAHLHACLSSSDQWCL
jgi:hypothetical protein